MAEYLILKPRSAQSRMFLQLVKDAEGQVVRKTGLGLIVDVKPSIGKALELIPIIAVHYYESTGDKKNLRRLLNRK